MTRPKRKLAILFVCFLAPACTLGDSLSHRASEPVREDGVERPKRVNVTRNPENGEKRVSVARSYSFGKKPIEDPFK